jgi:hypothetical protein
MLSYVISDLLSGRYLISPYKKTNKYKETFNNVVNVINKVNNNEKLDSEEKTLLYNMTILFYEGLPDMCEQLSINKENLVKLLN